MPVANVYMGAVVTFSSSRANMPGMNRMNRNANRPVNGSSLYRLFILLHPRIFLFSHLSLNI